MNTVRVSKVMEKSGWKSGGRRGINLSRSKYKLSASLSTERAARSVADCRWKEKRKEKRAWSGWKERRTVVVLHTKGPRRPRGIVLSRGGAHLHLGELRVLLFPPGNNR